MIDRFNNFENLFEGLKSTIVKRLQKDPRTRSKYVDGKYVDVIEYKVTSGFRSLQQSYDLEKLDDSYFQQITQEQAKKKPYNTEYQVFCFYKGIYYGYFIGTHVNSEGGGRRRGDILSRKALIDESDEFWAFDFERAKKEIYRHDIQRKRSEIKSDTELMYRGISYEDPKKLMYQDIKKKNLDRYYKAKSKNINFDEIFDLMQERLRRGYKELAFNVEECKTNPKKDYYYLTVKPDPILIEIAQMHYNSPKEADFFSSFNGALKSIQKFNQDFNKMKKGEDVSSYGKSSENEEVIKKLQRILGLLKGEIQLKEKK